MRWIVAVLVLLGLVAGGVYYYSAEGLPFPTRVPIGGARLVGPDVIGVFLECGRDAGATALEDETTVTIHAYLKIRPGDCGTEAWVELESPLADRVLIDGDDSGEIVIDR
jgi:hypothetical protein